MASDVLYESRDIEPLIDLIDRLLAQEGSSGFPAAPESRGAISGLPSHFAAGDSRPENELAAPRPATINVHFLRRELSSIRPYGIVRGWRV
ncbi:MAG: hypothetical protein R2849_05790 [Thermomicrobiales bacterium]